MNDPLKLWEESAEAWIALSGERGDSSRVFLDPHVDRLIGPVAGLKVLDIGCGEGRYARNLAAAGATVTGVEPVAALREKAIELGQAEFVDGLATELPFSDATFDSAIFYLVLIDVPDFRLAIREAFRVLKPGGRLISVNLTSIATAAPEPFWQLDHRGNRMARRVVHYCSEQPLVYEWGGMRIVNYHRPLSAYMEAYLSAGFQLEHFDEPVPNEADIELDPGRRHDLMAPLFNLMSWQRPF